MSGEQFIEFNEIDNQVLGEAIKRKCRVCNHLYHGTKQYFAQQLIDTKEINIGSEVGYLGNGFYCYLYDAEASRIYASDKYKKNNNERIAVIRLIVELGDVFFICPELHKYFLSIAQKLEGKEVLRKKVGGLIELFIKKIIIPNYEYIDTVAQCDNYNKSGINRPVFMYSIRHAKMVKDIKPYWEES